MRKNKLEYQLPQAEEVKRPSVLLPILLLIGITMFFVWGAKVKAFQLFQIPPDRTPTIESISSEAETPTTAVGEEATPETAVTMDAEQPALNLDEALNIALASAEGRWTANEWTVDSIELNDAGDQALVWLAAIDPETQMIRASEPVLAFGSKSPSTNDWAILLEDDPVFQKTLNASDLVESDVVSKTAPIVPKTIAEPKTYGGYFLPWKGGLEKRLTWSTSHSSCNPVYYCTHAFDFADGTMFELLAAKAGNVFYWKDTCKNGDPNCTNGIVLEDQSTTPWTYQIYLHIAKDSVPDALKTVGAPVSQGQLIAVVDDTGYSTGHHVHFMVVTKDTLYKTGSGYYFGRAEDITFRDVSINWDEETQGGRPLLAYEVVKRSQVGQTYYISGNIPMAYKYYFPLSFHSTLPLE